jgi:hypothetical protein
MQFICFFPCAFLQALLLRSTPSHLSAPPL